MGLTNQTGAEYLRQILRSPVYEVANVTPLQTMPRLSARIGNQVQIKREDRQPVHSFKLRGAYNMVSHLTEAQKAAGVIAASAGNHAQGMALSGTKLGIKTTIVMPRTTPDIKVEAYADLAAKYCCMAAISMKPKPKPNVYPKSKATPLYLRSITLW